MDFKLITCIVERGKADKIINKAIQSGAQAATYYYGKGRGIRERMGIVGKFIAPEKEIILVVTKQDKARVVFNAMVQAGELNVPGKGFAYIQSVEDAVGFLAM